MTVPGIRYVVDTGLARISRYSPHSRTQRLPIEAVAQSSANQRLGRCGRMSNGVCYRLYSQEDYLGRPRFNTPEIHRSNLASVILRMMAFKLGEIRTFPFIDPPADNAIIGGYRLLAELGAVTSDDESPNEDDFRLTSLGRRLSRLPVDPTVARMLLQAREENALDEVLVIASGLSIQDPRERPADAAKEADEMHKQFVHPESDFLTLLNIWNQFHNKLDGLSQNKLRKFCKAHFLSYQRMREWRDIHHQIARILDQRRTSNTKRLISNATPPSNPKFEVGRSKLDIQYEAIHRSILSGLLSNVAFKEEEHNYRGTRNRKALLFPGSGLFDHETAKKQRKASYTKKTKPKPAKTTAPNWIVCGEWMETARLYARTAAKIEIDWIEEIAGGLLSIRYSEPFWSTKSAAVLCKQRKLLFGLEIARNNFSYSRIEPSEATDIFVRNGLVEGGINERPKFFTSNEVLRMEAESEMARQQLGSAFLIEDRLFAFYRKRLNGVGSFAELRRFAKSKHGGSLDFLKARLEDLLPKNGQQSEKLFPKFIELGGNQIPLHYRNEPGHEADGVSLRIPITQLGAIQQGALDWAVPGHLEEKIESHIRALPKELRVQLHPLKDRAKELRQKIKPSNRPLSEQLTDLIKSEYDIQIYRDQWAKAEIPERLKPRIQVEDTTGVPITQGRSLESLKKQIKATSRSASVGENIDGIPAWQKVAAKYEKDNLCDWSFEDLPEEIDLSGESGLPLKAYPALECESGKVNLRILSDRNRAERATQEAFPMLCEVAMGRDLAWLRRDIKELKALGTGLLPLGGFDAIKEPAWDHLRRHLFRCDLPLPLRKAIFNETKGRAEHEHRGIVLKLRDQLNKLLEARAQVELLLEQKKTKQAISYPGMRVQMEQLAPADLLSKYEFGELPDLTRFLNGMLVRAKRAKESIQKDIEKSKRVAPFQTKLESLFKQTIKRKRVDSLKPFILLLEEFKISVFAQELGTRQKVSEKRLEKLASEIELSLR